MDDPLRLIRSVRFATKFGFQLDPAITEAAMDPEVRESLMHKVSNERIGIELDKILSGPNPSAGLGYLV